jgi:hypothetical protein
MNSSTWGRGVEVDRIGIRRAADQQSRDWDEDDSQLEQWHESHLGNACYLAIFSLVTLFTVLAFVPVWLVLQVQRAAGFFMRAG